MTAVETVEQAQTPTQRPAIKPGDTVRVHVKVREGDKERIQVFEGMVIGMHRGGARATFTVRKVSFGQGVERIFPLHSPIIDKIDVVRTARVRRAKLYFLRDLKGKAARMKEQKQHRLAVARPARGDRAWSKVRAFRTLENAIRRMGFNHVAGVDEVGRGCLAGPVVAAAVVLEPGPLHAAGLRLEDRDARSSASGCTSASRATAVAWARGRRRARARSTRINIHQASLRAMQRAVLALARCPTSCWSTRSASRTC